MTSNDSNIRASFRNLDGPVAVDPAFAERLRLAVATIHSDPDRTSLAKTRNLKPKTPISSFNLQPTTHRRWQDLVAAAVLLLALGGLLTGAIRILRSDEQGGIVLVLDQTPATTSDSQAATPTDGERALQQPVMLNRTAAGDGMIPGSAPTTDVYSKLWSVDGIYGSVTPFGDHIYVTRPFLDEGQSSGIGAYEAETGRELWFKPSALPFNFAVAEAGVVMAVAADDSDPSNGSVFIVLVSHVSGEEIWRSASSYSLSTNVQEGILIADNTVVFAKDGTGIVALDLTTGAERWTYAAELRPSSVFLAISSGVVYLENRERRTVDALSITDGSVLWQVSLTTRFESGADVRHLVATELGVLVGVEAANYGDQLGFGLWSSEDGSIVWQWDGARSVQFLVRTGETVLTSSVVADKCCEWDKVDLATGEIQQTFPYTGTSFGEYIADGEMIFGYTSDDQLVGADPETLEIIWTAPSDDCFFQLPFVQNGDIVCTLGRGMTVYRPVVPEADPEATASPAALVVADIPVINFTGSAANDGNDSGVMPPLGSTYELLWEGEAQEDTVRSTYIVGDVVVSLVSNTQPLADTNPYLVVQDVATGAERWRTPIANLPSGAITPRGIVLPTGSNSTGYGLVLLDVQTGAEIWSIGERFTSADQAYGMATVSGDTIYVKADETSVIALDLATGTERWTFDAAQGRTREEMLGECTPTSASCGNRVFQQSALIVVGDVVYRYVPVSGELVAVNTLDGTLLWSVNLAERTGIPAPNVRLIGTAFGVIPVVSGGLTSTQYLGLWQVSDGAEIWTRALAIRGAYVDLEILGVLRVDPENPSNCCLFTAIEIPTGSSMGEVRVGDWDLMAWSPESGVLSFSEILPSSGVDSWVFRGSYIFNATTDGTTDPIPADQIIPGCASITPGTDGLHVLCTQSNGQVAVYLAEEAGPDVEATTAVEATVAVTEGCFSQGVTVRVTEDGVNLREEPVIELNVLQQIGPGDSLDIVGAAAEVDAEGNAWCRVRSRETAMVGYVLEEFLERVDP